MPIQRDTALVAKLRQEYESGARLRQLEEHCSFSRETIRTMLVEDGVNLRTRSASARKYSVNHSFFSSIETEEQAYVLGFHAADGNVATGRPIFGVNLASKDAAHLQTILTAMQADYRVERRQWGKYPSASFHIFSPQIAADLTRLGFGPQKTFITKWPAGLLPDNLLKHFLRGYFDGDGSYTSFESDGHRYPVWEVVGSRDFLKGVEAFLYQQQAITPTKILSVKGSAICRLKHSGKSKIENISYLMYKDATIFLPRKLEKMLRITN